MKSIVIEEESVAQAAMKAIEAVFENGIEMNRTVGTWCMMKPGKALLHELHNVTITVTNPLKRWSTRVNAGMLTETLDYLLGLNPGYTHKSPWSFYKKWFLPKSEKYPYTYGERIFGYRNEIDQWNLAVNLLRKDPTTRHAHLTIYRPDDLTREFVPCNVAWHFQLDEMGHLNLTTFCRSQDAMKGLFLDCFSYTHFLEQMALATDLPLGRYTIFETNLHVYERDASKIKTEFGKPLEPYSYGIKPKGAQLLDKRGKSGLLKVLKQIYENRKFPETYDTLLPSYWKDFVIFIAIQLFQRSTKDVDALVSRIENKEISWVLKKNLARTRPGVTW